MLFWDETCKRREGRTPVEWVTSQGRCDSHQGLKGGLSGGAGGRGGILRGLPLIEGPERGHLICVGRSRDVCLANVGHGLTDIHFHCELRE